MDRRITKLSNIELVREKISNEMGKIPYVNDVEVKCAEGSMVSCTVTFRAPNRMMATLTEMIDIAAFNVKRAEFEADLDKAARRMNMMIGRINDIKYDELDDLRPIFKAMISRIRGHGRLDLEKINSQLCVTFRASKAVLDYSDTEHVGGGTVISPIPRFKTTAQFRDSVRQILDGIISVYALDLDEYR